MIETSTNKKHGLLVSIGARTVQRYRTSEARRTAAFARATDKSDTRAEQKAWVAG